MKNTRFDDDDRNMQKVGAHCGLACLLSGSPDAECNETWCGARNVELVIPLAEAIRKHAPVQTAFKARVQEKNELVILSCSLSKIMFVPRRDSVYTAVTPVA